MTHRIQRASSTPHLSLEAIVSSCTLLLFVLVLASCGNTPAAKQASPHPTPTPPSLFLLSAHGDLDAYRADGTHLWQGSASGNTGDIVPPIGTHLIVTDQMVYVATDTVRTYSRNGQLLWQHELSSQTDEMLLVGQSLFVAGDGGSIMAWDATTGALRWQQSVEQQTITALAHDAHTLFVAGQAESQVTAFNLQSGARVWSIQDNPGPMVETLSVEGDIVLVRTDEALTAVQATTGKTIWHRVSQVLTLYVDPTTSIIYTIFIDADTSPSSTASGLRALRLSTGEQLWHISFLTLNGENTTISSEGIVFANATSITAWDLDGKQRWQVPYVGQPIVHVASIDAGQVFLFISQGGTIIALDAHNGHQRWQQSAIEGTVQVQSGLIWIINPGIGDIRAFTFAGVRRWSLALSSSISDAVVV